MLHPRSSPMLARPGAWRLRGLLVSLGLLVACEPANLAEEPQEDASSLVLDLPAPGEPQADARDVKVEVLDLQVTPHGADAALSVTLRLHHRRRPTFDGTTTRLRDLLIHRSDISVLADGHPLESLDPDGQPWRLAASGHGRARLTATFRVPHAVMPRGMMLKVATDDGDAYLWLAGRPPADTRYVLPIAPDGAPLRDATVQVRTPDGGAADARRTGVDAPFALPSIGDEARVFASAPGFHAVAYGNSWSELAPLSRLALDPIGEATGLIFARATHGAFPMDPRYLDAAGATETLAADDALVAWVRDHIRPLPTHGLQRSPDTTAKLRAGGPIDRAVLLSGLLQARGHETRLACGDLSEEEAQSLYLAHEPLKMDGVPGTQITQAAADADALAGSLEAGLRALDNAPAGRPRLHQLIPEWCWVQRREGDAFIDLDLRPGVSPDQPLPFIWRTDDRMSRWSWPVRIQLRAVLAQGDPAAPAGFEMVDLAEHFTHAAQLTERALILDLWPVPGAPGELASALRVTTRRELITEAGPTLASTSLLRLFAEIQIVDPSGLLSQQLEVGLWERGDEGSPDALRVYLSGDSGASTHDSLHEGLQRALADLTPLHAETLLRVEHALHHAARRHAQGDAVALGPSLLATINAAHQGAVYGRRVELLPQAAASPTGTPTTTQEARLAAAEAGALHAGGHWLTVSAPERWVSDRGEVASLAATDARVGLEATRRMGEGALAATDRSKALWLLDPVSGSAYPHNVTPRVVSISPPNLLAPHPVEGWSVTYRCAWARKTAPHHHWATVKACQMPAGPTTPTGP